MLRNTGKDSWLNVPEICVFTLRAICVFALLTMPSIAIAKAKHGQAKVPSLPPPLTIEVQPTELTLDMTRRPHGQLLVLARNPKAARITSAALTFIPVAGLTTTVVKKQTTPWSSDLDWIVDVAVADSAPSPARLVAEVTYTASGHNPLARVSVATTTVTASSLTSVTDLKITLLPPDGLVEEEAPLDLTLEIDNPTRQTAQVKDFALLAPAKYVQFDPNQLPSLSEIAPGGTLAVPLRVIAGPAVPGTYTLVIGFNVAFSNRAAEWLQATAQGKISIHSG